MAKTPDIFGLCCWHKAWCRTQQHDEAALPAGFLKRRNEATVLHRNMPVLITTGGWQRYD